MLRLCGINWKELRAWLTFVAAVIALILAWTELRQFSNQTTLLEKTMRQQYRPICSVVPPSDNDGNIALLLPCDDAGTGQVCFHQQFQVRNWGTGPMRFLGVITLWSQDTFDVLGQMSDCRSSQLLFDGVHTDDRGVRINPGDSLQPVLFRWTNIEPKPKLFLHALLLYMDIDGNLYDTVYSIHLKGNAVVGNEEQGPLTMKPDVVLTKFTDHEYGADRLLRLGHLLEKYDHPLSVLLSNAP